MNTIPEFTIDSELLGFELYSESYNEFCNTLDELMTLNDDDEMYIEAMDDPRIKNGRGVRKVARRTIETTKDVAGAYGDIIDANGNLLKATWDLVMKSIKLCVRAISWILNKIALIPKFILGVINKIGRVPDYIKAKIRGDIRIYITIDDIALIYNKGLLVDIEQFFSKVEVLTKGEMWGTLFRRRGSNGATHSPFGQNDKKIIKEMRGIYGNISRINFAPTLVKMKDQKTIDTYFGSKKNINFKDVKGKEHSGTYLEVLQQLALTIQNKQNIMKTLQADLQQKFEDTRVNQEFGQLHPSDQRYIFDAMKMVANVITTLGNITRYVMEDVKTINIATETLIKKGRLEPKKEENSDQTEESK
ncbi:MAG: hypothetical protein NC548_12925 [Lachnospiraceae bacterium]|nr:hypothetical protein [Lachnospiraceae bacterium]MCM1230706.1 hypothetical protein [Ruminococcus flavefaciens]